MPRPARPEIWRADEEHVPPEHSGPPAGRSPFPEQRPNQQEHHADQSERTRRVRDRTEYGAAEIRSVEGLWNAESGTDRRAQREQERQQGQRDAHDSRRHQPDRERQGEHQRPCHAAPAPASARATARAGSGGRACALNSTRLPPVVGSSSRNHIRRVGASSAARSVGPLRPVLELRGEAAFPVRHPRVARSSRPPPRSCPRCHGAHLEHRVE